MNEPQLKAAIETVVTNGAFPYVAPPSTPRPYAVWQQVGGIPVNFLEGVGSDKKNARIQIKVYSDTAAEAMTLMRQLENVMVVAPQLGFILSGAVGLYDEETKLYGAMQDFSFWMTT